LPVLEFQNGIGAHHLAGLAPAFLTGQRGSAVVQPMRAKARRTVRNLDGAFWPFVGPNQPVDFLLGHAKGANWHFHVIAGFSSVIMGEKRGADRGDRRRNLDRTDRRPAPLSAEYHRSKRNCKTLSI
jgi:hypothetical protein